MSPQEASEWLKTPEPPLLLDVRGADENAFSALPNSVLIPLNELPTRWKELQTGKTVPILVYCHHGMRSLRAALFLRQCGFPVVENLDGGIDAWSLDVDPSVARY